MRKKKSPTESAEPRIVTVRGQRVILDADLAEMYGVATKVLNQAVKRNAARFPEDFAFQLTADEEAALRSQIVTLKTGEAGDDEESKANSSQFVILKKGRGQHRKFRPWAFTEHGALMAANILRSERAVQMSVFVVRAFVRQREQLSVNADVLRRLGEIDQTLLRHDDSIVAVLNIIKSLIAPRPSLPLPPPPKKRIGFQP